MDLPNIKYSGDVSKFITAKDDKYNEIMYLKDAEYFMDSVNVSKFVKAVEKMVRTSKDYSAFISTLKNQYGLTFSQISKYITDEDTAIEMHHGPLFTLYDIAEVITFHFLKTGQRINTFTVSNKVMQEHWDRNVQVMFVSITEHEGIHNKDIFINHTQCFGDINGFIKKYIDALSDDQKYKIWNYYNLCKNNEAFSKSFDTGLLDLEYVQKYIKI